LIDEGAVRRARSLTTARCALTYKHASGVHTNLHCNRSSLWGWDWGRSVTQANIHGAHSCLSHGSVASWHFVGALFIRIFVYRLGFTSVICMCSGTVF